jgi:Family of unknown function (DUF6418)
VGEGGAASVMIAGFQSAALSSALAIAVFAAALVWLAVSRPALCLLIFFFLMAFSWRLLSVSYIDLFGPVFSDQLEREVGPGASALPMAVSQAMVLVAMLFSFRRHRIERLFAATDHGLAARLPPGRVSLSDLAFWAVAVFVVALLIELVWRGPIPLFASIERVEYARTYGGPLHHRLLEWGPMLAFQLGVFFSAPLLHNRWPDLRFGALLAALILYLLLAGHRFSALYAYGSFFVMPLGAILLWYGANPPAVRNPRSRAILRWLAVAGVVLAILMVIAVTYSYIFVRGSGEDLFAKLSQRILVQQGEMWWMTYERVFVRGYWDGAAAAYKLFIDPFDPSKNSTMQFLMEQSLPMERARAIIAQGVAYTGGWPEVFFELAGPIGGFLLVALSAILLSEFMYLVMRCIVQERYATCFFLTPILFALSITVVSGMVNSFIQTTFAIKVIAALVAYVVEDKWRASLFSSKKAVSSSAEA